MSNSAKTRVAQGYAARPAARPSVRLPGQSIRWHSLYPELLAQYDQARNTVALDCLGFSSRRMAFWRCPKGPDHAWRARVSARTRGMACPFCVGLRVSVTNSLATVRPDLALQWHPRLNDGLTAEDVLPDDLRPVFWSCAHSPEHQWRQSVASRAADPAACPLCARAQRSIVARAPHLAAQWHPTRNHGLAPDQLEPDSTRLVWWRCEASPPHEWLTSPQQRSLGAGCPFCSLEPVRTAARDTDSLAAVAPALVPEWDAQRNGVLSPATVPASSHRRCWWRCAEGHVFRALVVNRVRGEAPCPSCSGRGE